MGGEVGVWEISWVGVEMCWQEVWSLLGDRRQRHATAEVETVEDGDPGAWPSGLLECSVMPVET